jgi:hypothetical protein
VAFFAGVLVQGALDDLQLAIRLSAPARLGAAGGGGGSSSSSAEPDATTAAAAAAQLAARTAGVVAPRIVPSRAVVYAQLIECPELRCETHLSTAHDHATTCGLDVGGEKNVLFEPFIYKNDHFTKTGSGQT